MNKVEIQSVIGNNLKSLRKKTYPSDTQADFAARIGIGRTTYQKMEKGDLSISLEKYIDAAILLDTTESIESWFIQSKQASNLIDELGLLDD